MNPETTVLVDYANENLQLKIDNARLKQRVAELEKSQGTEAGPSEAPDSNAS